MIKLKKKLDAVVYEIELKKEMEQNLVAAIERNKIEIARLKERLRILEEEEEDKNTKYDPLYVLNT